MQCSRFCSTDHGLWNTADVLSSNIMSALRRTCNVVNWSQSARIERHRERVHSGRHRLGIGRTVTHTHGSPTALRQGPRQGLAAVMPA